MKTNRKRTLISALCLTAVAGFIYTGAMVDYDAASSSVTAAVTPSSAPIASVGNGDGEVGTGAVLTPPANGTVWNGDGMRGTSTAVLPLDGSGALEVANGDGVRGSASTSAP